MPLYDFECKCGLKDEFICDSDVTTQICPVCGHEMKRVVSCPTILTKIIPSYPGSLKQKAGYVHTHGDKPATKVQSGYGGSQSPKN